MEYGKKIVNPLGFGICCTTFNIRLGELDLKDEAVMNHCKPKNVGLILPVSLFIVVLLSLFAI